MKTGDKHDIADRIATLMFDYMAIDQATTLGGEPLAELLDSLSLLEMLMLVEREWSVTLDFDEATRTPGFGVHDLAASVQAALARRERFPMPAPGSVPALASRPMAAALNVASPRIPA